MKNSQGIFLSPEKKLMKTSRLDDGGEYLQLYKDDWYNHNQGGIHFETYMEAHEIRQKEFPICLHAEEDCPLQQEFIQELLVLEGERIRNWKGYKTVGKGYTTCFRMLPVKSKKLDQRMFEELSRLRKLESGIEEALKQVPQRDGIR